MISSARPKAFEALLLAVLFLCAARLPALPAGWTIRIDGDDVTRAADPVESGEVLLIDVAAVAPSLQLTVRVDGSVFTLRDPRAGEWRGTAGSSLLSGPNGDVPLARPVRIDNRSVYLPVATAAALAGLVLSVDREARLAVLTRTAAAAAGGVAPPGWTAFSVAKAPGSYHPASPPVYGSGLPDFVPPAHDNVRLNATVGQASGAGSTLDVNGMGEVRGIDTRFGGLASRNLQGTQLVSGFVHLDQPDGFGLEAGDLFSEIWGSAQGIRVLGKEKGGGGRPVLSLYVPDGGSGLRQTVLAGRQELDLGRAASFTGEAASDGSWLLRARYKKPGFMLFAYGREAAGNGPGKGAGGVVALPAGITVNAGWDISGRGGDAFSGGNFSLSVPLPRRIDLALEAATIRTDRTRLITEALSLGGALGPVLVRTRYQIQSGSSLRADGGRNPLGQRDLLVSLAYALSNRWRFNLLAVSHSPLRDDTQRWAQLGIAWKVLPTTLLQVLATSPGASIQDPLHLRLEQLLGSDFSLFVEYGFLPSFAAGSQKSGAAQWKVSLRKIWDVPTPAGGGRVEGRVSTPVGRLGSDLPVELGPYRTTTDAQGDFVFRHVPPGNYPLAVPPQALPAAYRAPAARTVGVAAREIHRVELPLIPLGTVSGWVYVDRGNGERGPAAGIAGVVVRLDDLVTATGQDGTFAFHNVEPGTHRLSLDVSRLPAGVGATIPSSLDVGLPPGGRLDHVALRLVPRGKPVIFQELGR